MRLSTLYSLVGITALATLSLVHWIRNQHYDLPTLAKYVLGVLPNFLAAVAIPFVFLSLWIDRISDPTGPAARQRFIVLTLLAGFGLIAWEFLQRSSHTLVFDPHDIATTIAGLLVAWILFLLITPGAGTPGRL